MRNEPERILKKEAIVEKSLFLIRILTNKGVYYYSDKLVLLLGPLQNDSIKFIDYKSCYIYEKRGNLITHVSYIMLENGTYICNTISSKNGIKVKLHKSQKNILLNSYFFSINNDGKNNIYSPKLQLIMQNIDDYTINTGFDENGDYFLIIGYTNKTPSNICRLYIKRDVKMFTQELEFICDGISLFEYDNSYVYKSEKNIICIRKNGEILFSVKGDTCNIKIWQNYAKEKKESDTKVYVIENNDSILVLDKNGNPI